ncbi:hypothetical protein [Nocardia sp. NBC_01327]|uniref:hypothetical protein n=1 Tax=Nocardia sp. NBC_01327 TaxID=2903593 RepID=UPI002E0EF83B|nr:hypothetical protein OG326_24185 [Nocardia sp. NBC_01327]
MAELLTDDELRAVADDKATPAAGIAAELLSLRARITEVEGICAKWADAHDRSKASHRSRVSQLMGRIAELEQQARDEGASVGRLTDALRTACTAGADAKAYAAELEQQAGQSLGHVIVTEVEGREPYIHGDHRQVMTAADAIRSVGRSDLPRGMTLKLCELREVSDRG